MAWLALGGCKSEVTEGGGGAGSGAGGSGGTGSGAGGSGGSGATGAGGSIAEGDCQSPADCGGNDCLEITPGGFKACADTVVEATSCTSSGMDECCSTAECSQGICLTAPLMPYCGGPQPLEYNTCAVDACSDDGDCAGNVCLPAPMLGYQIRSCFAAQCKLSSDCTAEAGGVCAPVADACCYGAIGLYCVYPSDGCRTNQDCGIDEHCQPTFDRAHCEAGPPTCPA